MAGLAYLLLPITGVVAYLIGSTARVRFHGLQAIAIGLAWPVLLYATSLTAAVVTQFVFVAGAAVWLLFMVATATGRDPKLPRLWKPLRRVAVAWDEARSARGAR